MFVASLNCKPEWRTSAGHDRVNVRAGVEKRADDVSSLQARRQQQRRFARPIAMFDVGSTSQQHRDHFLPVLDASQQQRRHAIDDTTVVIWIVSTLEQHVHNTGHPSQGSLGQDRVASGDSLAGACACFNERFHDVPIAARSGDG